MSGLYAQGEERAAGWPGLQRAGRGAVYVLGGTLVTARSDGLCKFAGRRGYAEMLAERTLWLDARAAVARLSRHDDGNASS